MKLRESEGDQGFAVRLFAPESGEADWSCRYEIEWPKGTAARAASGVDAVQALELALSMIASELYASEAHAQGRLVWEKVGAGYGFPPPPNLRSRAVGEDKEHF